MRALYASPPLEVVTPGSRTASCAEDLWFPLAIAIGRALRVALLLCAKVRLDSISWPKQSRRRMANDLAASLDIDTGLASCSVRRFEPRSSATAERVCVKTGEVISGYSHLPPYGPPDFGEMIVPKTKHP